MWSISKKKNNLILDVLHNSYQGNSLRHHGILGMHWGIRRFQPYGQGYNPDHKGKEIGLAARLAGSGSSYKQLYGRSPKTSAVSVLRGAGKNVSSGINEALERLNYASDRMGQAIKSTGNKTRRSLAEYAARYDKPIGNHIGNHKSDPMLTALYSSDMTSNSRLAKKVAEQFGRDTKAKISEIRSVSYNDIMSRLGHGASDFQSTMQKTKVASKDFSRNAKLTMALLAGAADPTSSASQILEGRWDSSQKTSSRRMGATTGARDMLRLSSLDSKKNSSEKLGDYLRRVSSPAEMHKMGFTESSNKYLDEIRKKDQEFRAKQDKIRFGQGDYAHEQLGYDRRGRDLTGSSSRLDLKSRDKQLQEFGNHISNYMKSPNNQTTAERAMESSRAGLLMLDEAITPAARGARVDSDYFKNMSQMERRLLGF